MRLPTTLRALLIGGSLLAGALAVALAAAPPGGQPGPQPQPGPPPGADAAQRAYGLLPASPLASRIGATPPAVLRMFVEADLGTPTAHPLTAAERSRVIAALSVLPPWHRAVLGDRLRTISFLDGMPNTALTSTVNPDEPYRLFDLTIRAGVLSETVSEFVTAKERTCFTTDGSPLRVAIEAGDMPAIVYVLLHEATHIVDGGLGLTPDRRDGGDPMPSTFTAGVWIDRLTIAPSQRADLLHRLAYRRGGEAFDVARAPEIYDVLRRTPFASLYASSNWHDDLAELLAWYHLTQKLGQPYRIVVREGAREVYGYAPMDEAGVRARFAQLARFYAADGKASPPG